MSFELIFKIECKFLIINIKFREKNQIQKREKSATKFF